MLEEKQEEKRRKGAILWYVIILLMITNILTLWLWQTSEREIVREKIITKEVQGEKVNLQEDLLELRDEYANLQTSDKLMQADIDAKRLRIEELMKEAEKHKGDAYIIKKLREETKTLRQIMIGYVHTIDSLGTLNKNLVAEKKAGVRWIAKTFLNSLKLF